MTGVLLPLRRHFVLAFLKMSRDKNLQDFWRFCTTWFQPCPGSSPVDPPFWKSSRRRPWGRGCEESIKYLWFSIYTLSDLGVLSNLIGSLSLANEHYSPPTEWIMRKPNKNRMAGVNPRFASVSELIFNGFLLKMLLRSLRVYILKQLFFSISVNSGRIFTSPLRGSVNILPLFTSISKNNC